MSYKAWLLFLTMETALSLSPGPAVFYVVAQALRSPSRALPATLGILSANGFYFLLSATSLGALIAGSARFFAVARWVGACYLVYLGIKSLRAAANSHAAVFSGNASSAGQTAAGNDNAAYHEAAAKSYNAADAGSVRQIYLGALTLQLSNPKALLSFLAVLPQFIDTHKPIAAQMAILAASSMLPEFCILLGYGWLAQRAARASARLGMTGKAKRWLAWIEGLALLGCATLVLRFSQPD